jgi:iron(III) transport system substrate-binding protein
MEFLASEDGQALYASADFEYPVRKNVQADPMLTSFGPLVIDSLSLNQIAAQRKKASALVDRVRFDQ